jgi:hypothetical protein
MRFQKQLVRTVVSIMDKKDLTAARAFWFVLLGAGVSGGSSGEAEDIIDRQTFFRSVSMLKRMARSIMEMNKVFFKHFYILECIDFFG